MIKIPNYNAFNNAPDNLKTQIFGSNSLIPISTDSQGIVSAGILSLGPNLDSLLNKLQTSVNTSVLEVTPQYGISALRDIITIAGGATITSDGTEYILSTSAAANDSATLDTAENGRYTVGASAEAAIEVRLPTAPIGTQVARWGYFSNDDGFYFGQDSTGVFIATKKATVETKVYQSSWNADKLDGTGPSNETLDLSKGNQFQFVYLFAFGIVEFRVILQNSANIQKVITVDRFRINNSVNVRDPSLPVRAQIVNGTSVVLSLYILVREVTFF